MKTPEPAPPCKHDFDDLGIAHSEQGVPFLYCTKCRSCFTRVGQQILVMFAALKRRLAPPQVLGPRDN